MGNHAINECIYRPTFLDKAMIAKAGGRQRLCLIFSSGKPGFLLRLCILFERNLDLFGGWLLYLFERNIGSICFWRRRQGDRVGAHIGSPHLTHKAANPEHDEWAHLILWFAQAWHLKNIFKKRCKYSKMWDDKVWLNTTEESWDWILIKLTRQPRRVGHKTRLFHISNFQF